MTSRRLDCLVCGRDRDDRDSAVIVELKQWEKCEDSDGENEVCTWLGGRVRDVLHPSAQVGQYKRYLQDTHTAFYEGDHPVSVGACAYLHNYHGVPNDVLFSGKFHHHLTDSPTFTADDTERLEDYMRARLGSGCGIDVLARIEQGKYRPSKKLMEHVGNVIKNKPEYVLLDEQLVVYDKVLACAKRGFHDGLKTVLIVKGGPGTGKSVIAINLMADLLLKKYNAHYAAGSKAFTETLRKAIGPRGAVQFKYFNSYAGAEQNAIDVLVADEAHRIRFTSNSRFTAKDKKSGLSQIEELSKAAKVCVFFLDDNQVVRPDEIGSAEYIRNHAEKSGARIFEYELEAQFRCAGSDAFVRWINNTLAIERSPNVIWDSANDFEFRVFPSPQALDLAIRSRLAEGFSARMAAGYCWPWSGPKPDGTLVEDVTIGDFRRPWNAKPDAGKLTRGIPKSYLWAYESGGINQVGCVYTAQGFEFDYVGVIFGEDLVYDFDSQSWVGKRERSEDNVVKRSKEKFVELVKNTYRVLLTRGLKGCYVCFLDKNTERFFRSRMETSVATTVADAASVADAKKEERSLAITPNESVPEKLKYVEFLPVYSLKAAASGFSDNQYVEPLGWAKASQLVGVDRSLFVAKVVGKSMEPTVPDGSFCVFRIEKGGSRDGKVVLVESRALKDPESGQRYTVKRYRSEKDFSSDGTWRHKSITLTPDNSDFPEIVLQDIHPLDFNVVAELVRVL